MLISCVCRTLFCRACGQFRHCSAVGNATCRPHLHLCQPVSFCHKRFAPSRDVLDVMQQCSHEDRGHSKSAASAFCDSICGCRCGPHSSKLCRSSKSRSPACWFSQANIASDVQAVHCKVQSTCCSSVKRSHARALQRCRGCQLQRPVDQRHNQWPWIASGGPVPLCRPHLQTLTMRDGVEKRGHGVKARAVLELLSVCALCSECITCVAHSLLTAVHTTRSNPSPPLPSCACVYLACMCRARCIAASQTMLHWSLRAIGFALW